MRCQQAQVRCNYTPRSSSGCTGASSSSSVVPRRHVRVLAPRLRPACLDEPSCSVLWFVSTIDERLSSPDSRICMPLLGWRWNLSQRLQPQRAPGRHLHGFYITVFQVASFLCCYPILKSSAQYVHERTWNFLG